MGELICINVKLNHGWTINVEAQRDWTVGRFKTAVIEKLPGTSDVRSHSEVHLMFAGSLLSDSDFLRDCAIDEQTLLHIIFDASLQSVSDACPTSLASFKDCGQTESNSQPGKHDVTQKAVSSNFYAYCKSKCKRVVAAKLRVCCSVCKQSAIQLKREPTCWDDVLMKNKISCQCFTSECIGEIAEFYFRCAEHIAHDGCGDIVTPLPLLVPNRDAKQTCMSCLEPDRNPMLSFLCNTKHILCIDCFKQYSISQLNQRSFKLHPKLGYTLSCPADCDGSLIEETHHFRILGDQEYERYQKFGTEECVLIAGGVLCPTPDCGAGIVADADLRRLVCRQGCQRSFCRNCLAPYHPDPCTHSAQPRASFCTSAEFNWQEIKSQETIKSTTKPCPGCKCPTEHDGGCMHMVCARSMCNLEWCWQCETEWSRDCQGTHWFG